MILNWLRTTQFYLKTTLVREPMAHAVSKVLQVIGDEHNVRTYFNEPFMSRCMKLANDYLGELFDWFDCELRAAFGIDIFEYPFNRERGYSVTKQGNISILVMRLENLYNLECVIGSFVGVSNFKLENANEANQKLYKYLYDDVRKAIKIPRSLVDSLYKGNQKMDHFYTKEEKENFLKKWEANII